MLIHMLFVAVGVVLLATGGEALIRGALAAAQRLGVSPLLTGLLIVGFGTSAPELVVSIDAALRGQPDIAVGNVVGSNIGNLLLILGVAAVITPLAVQPLALRRDAIVVVAASVLFLVLVAGNALVRTDAVILLGALAAYMIWAYRTERRQDSPATTLHEAEAHAITLRPRSTWWTGVLLGGGLALLIVGSQILLKGAIGIAEQAGVSQAFIGLTLIAVGTSLPELSVSVIAALRRQADVAIGNILGSNIFNVLGILGVSAILQPLPIHARILQFDQWILLATALLILLFLYTGRRLSRIEGAVLLLGYAIYVAVGYIAFAR